MSILIIGMDMPTDEPIRIILHQDGTAIKANAIDYEEYKAVTFNYVRRGTWVRNPDSWCVCSECGQNYYAPSLTFLGYNYCPNCGARMTDEVKE